MVLADGRGNREPQAGEAQIRGEVSSCPAQSIMMESEALGTKKRDKAAALKFPRKAMKRAEIRG